jgi:RecB family exonuclease
VITPRATRLVRADDLAAFRASVAVLASEGSPLDARDRLVIVPTRAAAALLTASLERRVLTGGAAMLHSEFITARELPERFASRADPGLIPCRPESREILMSVACRLAGATCPPPFELRAGLIAEVLDFYDGLLRRRKDVSTFERLALNRLEPGADSDRGAERLVRQTRFLAEAFRVFERLSVERGFSDEHALRQRSLTTAAERPWRHAIVTVADEARDKYGLWAADWDLLTRVTGLERLDLVVTDQSLAGAWHERVHELLPGIEEVRLVERSTRVASLRIPSASRVLAEESRAGSPSPAWESRDREDEVADFARWVRGLRRDEPNGAIDRIALVVRQPLPYLYVAPEVLRSANIPCQTFESWPLAVEPYAAVFDLVCAAVSTSMARTAALALLSSPHLKWSTDDSLLTPASIAAASRLLSERRYLGGIDALQRIVTEVARSAGTSPPGSIAAPALEALLAAALELEALSHPAPAAEHLDVLLNVLVRHDAGVPADDPRRARRLRARAAVQGVLTVLRNEYLELDEHPVEFAAVAALVRRWIDSRTFSPRMGHDGIRLVDADSAKFGDFDHVQIAGLVDGEWPENPRRNIFYGTGLLRDLGWSGEAERTDYARGAFVDLLGLPLRTLTVSTFALEDDSLVQPSPLLDELDAQVSLEQVPARLDEAVIFDLEALTLYPTVFEGMVDSVQQAVELRQLRLAGDGRRFHGFTSGHEVRWHSLSGLERYQDCPFKFFAHDVLRLTEPPEDEPFLSPLTRGRLIHEVFHRFFAAWDARGARTITVENIDDARQVFAGVAEPLLRPLGASDAALERLRLFGSAVAVGLIDVVLGLEASAPAEVTERWLELPFKGLFSLGQQNGPQVALRGTADRIDLLDGNRLRVIDYKSGHPPAARRALQVPIYALCAQEQAQRRDGQPWQVDEAAYIAFSGKQTFVPVIRSGKDPTPALAAARERLLEAVVGVSAGEFPPRPDDVMLCRTCAYSAVCRKDYVSD